MLEFSEFLPDQPDYTNPGANDAKNVLPLTNKSYAPLRALSSNSDALDNRPQGAAAFVNAAGVPFTFAGDLENLFLLSGVTWNEISKVAGDYTTAAEDSIEFVKFGERIISCNGLTDLIQSYVMNSSSDFADLAAAAPKARHMAVIGDFVMVGNTSDAGDGAVPYRVWWCAINDPTSWPTIGSAVAAAVQSDRQDLRSGGWIQGLTGAVGGADGAVWTDHSIYRITYEGSPLVFSFDEIERGRGTPAPKSIVNVGPWAFYLGTDGFYAFDGAVSTPIGNQKVDKFFYADMDSNYLHRIYGVADPINKLLFWAYAGVGNMAGRPNRMIMYNWEIGRWSYAEVDLDFLFNNAAVGLTLEQLDTFGNLDTLPYSLDSRIWIGGNAVLSAFDVDHKLAAFSGETLAATLTTTEFGGMELFQKPNERLYINGMRPYVDGGDVTVSLTYRDSPSGAVSTDGPSAVDTNGMAHFTRSCRYARATVNIAAAGTWSHAQGVDPDADEDGEF
jgi:hypothetical protein